MPERLWISIFNAYIYWKQWLKDIASSRHDISLKGTIYDNKSNMFLIKFFEFLLCRYLAWLNARYCLYLQGRGMWKTVVSEELVRFKVLSEDPTCCKVLKRILWCRVLISKNRQYDISGAQNHQNDDQLLNLAAMTRASKFCGLH